MTRFFAWKILRRCAMLLVVSTVFLTSGYAASAATTHGTSVTSHLVTPHQNVVANIVHANATLDGCPSGYVCIFGGADDDETMDMYYYYDIYDLPYETGYHYIVNNQTDQAQVAVCPFSDGGGCDGSQLGRYMIPGAVWYIDFKYVGSIVLYQYYWPTTEGPAAP